MRIDLNARTSQVPEQASSESARATSRTQQSTGNAEDQATVLNAVRVSSLAAQVGQMAEVRQAKVDALARSIQQGRYHVSSDRIADAMLSERMAKPVAS